MFGLGAMEVVVILLLALIVLGPEKLPEVARKMARFTGELRRVSDEVRRNFDEASRDMEDLRKPVVPPPASRPAPVQSIAQSAPPPEAHAGHQAADAHVNCDHPSHKAPAEPTSPQTDVTTASADKPKGDGHA